MKQFFSFPIPFSEEELMTIRNHFDPQHYNPKKESDEDRNKNRIWALPVRKILIPRFKHELKRLKDILNYTPKVALVMVGEDPNSRSYVEHLGKITKECGIENEELVIGEHEGQSKLLKVLNTIKEDRRYTGVIPQLPLPKNFNEEEMRTELDPSKDIDGLHPGNLMQFTYGKAPLLPTMIGGVAMAIHTYGIPLNEGDKDKEIAILGQGETGGKPLATLFGSVYKRGYRAINEDTSGIPERLQRYDIIISATNQMEEYDERIINPMRKQVLLDIDFGKKGDKIVGGFTQEAHRLAYMSMRNPGGSGLFTQLYAVHNILTLAERKAKKIKHDFNLYQI